MRTTKTTADAQESLCDLTFEDKEEGEICEFMDHGIERTRVVLVTELVWVSRNGSRQKLVSYSPYSKIIYSNT